MNQRISVRAIIKEEGKTLFLRRATGRQSILGLYELPGGRVAYGEQPEDTLRRVLHDDAGLHMDRSELVDVISYIDKDDRDIQYAVITYNVLLSEGHHSIKLGSGYDNYLWQSSKNTQQNTLTDLTELILGIIRQSELTEVDDDVDVVDNSTDVVVIYTDGGSRGNPGPSASGYVIMNSNKEVIDSGGEYLGITTNNQAEYQAVRLALEKAIERGYENIDFNLDSMLVVNQMKGVYSVKNRDLWPVNERIHELMKKLKKVTFRHVPRELNQLADSEVNKVLDQHKDFE